MPYFSVIIPTYNRSKMLIRAVQSVLDQTFADFELIIVDDHSTDDTKARVELLDDPRIFYYRRERNEERGAARNFGMKVASGEIAVFLDSDDRMFPHYLETLVSVARHSHIPIFAVKHTVGENSSPKPRLMAGEYDYRSLLLDNPFACNIAVRLKNSDIVPFLEDRKFSRTEDWLFLFHNLTRVKLYLLDEVTVHMDDHPQRSLYEDNAFLAACRHSTDWLMNNIPLESVVRRRLEARFHLVSAERMLRKGRIIKSLEHAVRMLWYDRGSLASIRLLGKAVLRFFGIRKGPGD